MELELNVVQFFNVSPEEKIRQQETKIMQLIEESSIAQCSGDKRKALSKAKEASNKERNLIRFQEQAGLGDHNSELTYVVSFGYFDLFNY